MIHGERNPHACEVLAEAGSCPHLIMVGDLKAALETLRTSVA